MSWKEEIRQCLSNLFVFFCISQFKKNPPLHFIEASKINFWNLGRNVKLKQEEESESVVWREFAEKERSPWWWLRWWGWHLVLRNLFLSATLLPTSTHPQSMLASTVSQIKGPQVLSAPPPHCASALSQWVMWACFPYFGHVAVNKSQGALGTCVTLLHSAQRRAWAIGHWKY